MFEVILGLLGLALMFAGTVGLALYAIEQFRPHPPAVDQEPDVLACLASVGDEVDHRVFPIERAA
jgi:hypothetical protein